MTEGVEFEEDKSYVHRIKRQKEIPQKGIEGFVYNKMPGKYSYKKSMLILIIIVIFILSFTFFILGIQNLGESPSSNFGNRVDSTRSR